MLIEIEEEMTESDVFGNILYQGGYRIDNDNMEFVREGYGTERRLNVNYTGDWKENRKEGLGKIEKNGIVIFDGRWKNNAPESKGCLYNLEGKEICNGNWVKGVCRKWYWNDSENCFNEKIEMIDSSQTVIPIANKKEKKRRITQKLWIPIILLFLVAFVLLYLFPPKFYVWKYTSELIIEENSYNDWKDDLVIENYPNLEKIVVKRNSLMNLNLLKIWK